MLDDAQQVTLDNWQHTGLRSAELLAFVHLAATPPPPEEEEARLSYCVTLGDLEFRELMQWEFGKLEEALDFLHRQYGDWELHDTRRSGEGCDTCSAH